MAKLPYILPYKFAGRKKATLAAKKAAFQPPETQNASSFPGAVIDDDDFGDVVEAGDLLGAAEAPGEDH